MPTFDTSARRPARRPTPFHRSPIGERHPRRHRPHRFHGSGQPRIPSRPRPTAHRTVFAVPFHPLIRFRRRIAKQPGGGFQVLIPAHSTRRRELCERPRNWPIPVDPGPATRVPRGPRQRHACSQRHHGLLARWVDPGELPLPVGRATIPEPLGREFFDPSTAVPGVPATPGSCSMLAPTSTPEALCARGGRAALPRPATW